MQTECDSFEPGVKVAGRYLIGSVTRQGGMSLILKATDLQTDRSVALKIPRPDANPKLAELSFRRELQALESLQHDNIVRFLDVGMVGAIPYLVMEWLETSFKDRIQTGIPPDWQAFYADFGRPVLHALAYAHRRNISHRDLKPHNLLFDAAGTLKIVDFGLARDKEVPNYGETLRHAGSFPYTPADADDGVSGASRDAYSWAVVSLSCLSGRLFSDLGAVQEALAKLDEKAAPVAALAKAISANPADRYKSGIDLLLDTDTFERKLSSARKIFVQLEIGSRAARMLSANWPGKEQAELEKFLVDDLSAASAFQAVEVLGQEGVRIVGASLEAIARRPTPTYPALRIEELGVLGVDRADQMRKDMPEILGLQLAVYSQAYPVQDALKDLRNFEVRLRIEQSLYELDVQRRIRERWLDCWQAFLREKERSGRVDRLQFKYRRMHREQQRFIATCDGELDPDNIPESLILKRTEGPLLLFRVVDLYIDQLVLELQGSLHDQVPLDGGVLEVNRAAELQALHRQKAALDLIRRDGAASPLLKNILSTPAEATLPERSGLGAGSVDLSKDKHDVLDRALGVTSVLAIEGPPGTGKTTLIAELVQVHLRMNPRSRILLSSQTHIALDHVLAKLVEKGLGSQVVRLHGDQIGKVSTEIIPLTLDQKAKTWVMETERRARTYLSTRAVELGFERDHVEIALLAQQRAGLDEQLTISKAQIADLEEELAAANAKVVDDPALELEHADETVTVLDDLASLRDSVRSLEARKRQCDAQLAQLGDIGKELVTATESQRQDWIHLLNPPSTPEAQRFVELLKLQLAWLGRLGGTRDFHPAVLGQARIVAGTCVGLGGILPVIDQKFDLCIIDEVSKATATETLIPMAFSKKWVLVGDPRQLPPYFDRMRAPQIEGFTDEETRLTLMDIFLRSLPEECKAKLKEQRRMAGAIGELVSAVFYDGALETARSEKDRNPAIRRAFPRSVSWISTSGAGAREESQPGQTFRNRKECAAIAELLERIEDACARESRTVSVAIISSYSAQVKSIRYQLTSINVKLRHLTWEVNTVDAFQGRDADICIYSVTRSNPQQRLGFQREIRRLNVALSRGRDALVIVGDLQFCRSIERDNPFQGVIDFIEANPEGCEVRSDV